MSRTRSRALPITIALAVLVAGGYGWQLWRAAAAAAELRAAVLSSVDVAVAKRPLDGEELSRCVADLQRLPEHDSDNECRFALARIELARDRAERAEALFATIGGRPDAPPAWQRFTARVLLRRHEADLGDEALTTLRHVTDLARAAYNDGQDAEDLLCAWQAAVRLADDELAGSLAKQLEEQQPESPAARFVRFAGAYDPASGLAGVDAAVIGLASEPAEASAMRAMATLQLGDVRAAVAAAEAALARAPGVASVRQAAVGVFHAAALGSAAGSDDRARWLARRDAQIDWLLQLPGWPEARRAGVRALRDQR